MLLLIRSMKKVFLLWLLVSQAVYAQINWGEYSQTFPDDALGNPSTVALVLAVRRGNDSFWNQHTNNDAFTGIDKDASFQNLHAPDPIRRPTFDTAKAHFFLHGVTPQNAAAYRFRVIDYTANRTVVPWQPIRQFTDSVLNKQAGLPPMAYLGGYRAPLGHTLVVDVRRTDSEQITGTAMVAWVPIQPRVTSLYTSDNLDAFLRKLQYPWARESNPSPLEPSAGPLLLPPTNTNLVLLLNATIYNKEQLQYELIRDGEVVRHWQNNEYDNSFIWLKGYVPGDYRLRIRYSAQPQHTTEFCFEVAPTWYQSGVFRLMCGFVLVAGLGAVVLIVLFIRQQQRSRTELAKKTKLQLDLKTLYAQFNPHFVFNAMSSIQGLINKQDIAGANQYLADFARLMRESLANSNREMVSLDEEIRMLNTYLRLEQLRFGFQFQILLDEAINAYSTDIPALLLQPLIENAVKHGVAAKGNDGLITVRFSRTNDTLMAQVTDNGTGMSEAGTGGFGLKLTQDRINLLNELNPTQPISLLINVAVPAGAEVTVRFNHWFA